MIALVIFKFLFSNFCGYSQNVALVLSQNTDWRRPLKKIFFFLNLLPDPWITKMLFIFFKLKLAHKKCLDGETNRVGMGAIELDSGGVQDIENIGKMKSRFCPSQTVKELEG